MRADGSERLSTRAKVDDCDDERDRSMRDDAPRFIGLGMGQTRE